MIVRISSEGQYRVEDTHKARLGELDEAVRVAADHADEAGFTASFAAAQVEFTGEGLIPD
jgi:hypothetical protein